MKTKNELIEEVLRLDGERTQGDWRGGFNGTCYQVDSEMDAVCTTQFCYAPESKQNAAFIALAPDMATLIRDQQKQIELLVEALEGVQFAVMRDGGSTLIPETLAKIKSGEWL